MTSPIKTFGHSIPLGLAGLALIVGTASVEYTLKHIPEEQRPKTYLQSGQFSDIIHECKFETDARMYVLLGMAGLTMAGYQKKR